MVEQYVIYKYRDAKIKMTKISSKGLTSNSTKVCTSEISRYTVIDIICMEYTVPAGIHKLGLGIRNPL